MVTLYCEYCKKYYQSPRRKKWHNCPEACRARRAEHRKNCTGNGRIKGFALHTRKRDVGTHVCRRCGDKTHNYFFCPACLSHMAKVEELATHCLGYELEAGW